MSFSWLKLLSLSQDVTGSVKAICKRMWMLKKPAGSHEFQNVMLFCIVQNKRKILDLSLVKSFLASNYLYSMLDLHRNT